MSLENWTILSELVLDCAKITIIKYIKRPQFL